MFFKYSIRVIECDKCHRERGTKKIWFLACKRNSVLSVFSTLCFRSFRVEKKCICTRICFHSIHVSHTVTSQLPLVVHSFWNCRKRHFLCYDYCHCTRLTINRDREIKIAANFLSLCPHHAGDKLLNRD